MSNTINNARYLFIGQPIAMLLYKWRYALFSSFLLAELVSWLVIKTPAGIFFDALPCFVFTTFMWIFLCSPLVCILYWTSLGWRYWRTAWGKADAFSFAVSVVVFLPKLLFILIIIAEEN